MPESPSKSTQSAPPSDFPGGKVVVLRYDAFYLGIFLCVILVGLAFLMGRQSARVDAAAGRPLVLRTGGQPKSTYRATPAAGPNAAGPSTPRNPSGAVGVSGGVSAPGQGDAGVTATEPMLQPNTGVLSTTPAPATPSEAQPVPGASAAVPQAQPPAEAWYIQCMHTMDEEEARSVVAFLKTEGLDGFLKPSGSRKPPVYLVAVGPFAGQPREVYDRVRGLKYRGVTRFRDAFFFSY